MMVEDELALLEGTGLEAGYPLELEGLLEGTGVLTG
jgi:hypothetical protein